MIPATAPKKWFLPREFVLSEPYERRSTAEPSAVELLLVAAWAGRPARSPVARYTGHGFGDEAGLAIKLKDAPQCAAVNPVSSRVRVWQRARPVRPLSMRRQDLPEIILRGIDDTGALEGHARRTRFIEARITTEPV